eukprot:gene9634-7548_t
MSTQTSKEYGKFYNNYDHTGKRSVKSTYVPDSEHELKTNLTASGSFTQPSFSGRFNPYNESAEIAKRMGSEGFSPDRSHHRKNGIGINACNTQVGRWGEAGEEAESEGGGGEHGNGIGDGDATGKGDSDGDGIRGWDGHVTGGEHGNGIGDGDATGKSDSDGDGISGWNGHVTGGEHGNGIGDGDATGKSDSDGDGISSWDGHGNGIGNMDWDGDSIGGWDGHRTGFGNRQHLFTDLPGQTFNNASRDKFANKATFVKANNRQSTNQDSLNSAPLASSKACAGKHWAAQTSLRHLTSITRSVKPEL